MSDQITCPICGRRFNNPVMAISVHEAGVLTIRPSGSVPRKAFVQFECPNSACSAHFQIEWEIVREIVPLGH